MRLIDADKIDFREVFEGYSDSAKDMRAAAEELIDRQPVFYTESLIAELERKPKEESTLPKTKRRIYISGPITGTADYMERFDRAEKEIEAAGHEAVNPAKVMAQLPSSVTWEECMQLSFAMLDICDGIYLMEGWKDSKGAVMELHHAVRHEKTVICKEECHHVFHCAGGRSMPEGWGGL